MNNVLNNSEKNEFPKEKLINISTTENVKKNNQIVIVNEQVNKDIINMLWYCYDVGTGVTKSRNIQCILY